MVKKIVSQTLFYKLNILYVPLNIKRIRFLGCLEKNNKKKNGIELSQTIIHYSFSQCTNLLMHIVPFSKVVGRVAYSTLSECLDMTQQEELYAFVRISEGIIKVRTTVCNLHN